ncbi:MAG: DUF1080 domain-containing protein [Planctomycetes bacterium]|nr:DUF1080 domain-containing protein [Planctomycetota bacterium]
MRKIVLMTTVCVALSVFLLPVLADEVTADLLYEKGMSDFDKKNNTAAEAAFLKAIESFPGHLKSISKLAELYELNPKKQAESITYYTRAYEILCKKSKPSDEDNSQKAFIEKKLDQLDKLNAKLKSEHNAYINTLLSIAEEAKRKKRFDFAGKLYDEVLMLSPKDPNALEGKKKIKELIAKNGKEAGDTPANNDTNGSGEVDIFSGQDTDSLRMEEGKWEVKNGELYPTTAKGGAIVYDTAGFEGKYSMTVEFMSDGKMPAGVLLGFNGTGKNTFAVIVSEQAFLLSKSEISGSTAKLLVLVSGITQNYKTEELNSLRVTVDSDKVSAYLNGEKIFENQKVDQEISGKLAVIASSNEMRIKTIKAKTENGD